MPSWKAFLSAPTLLWCAAGAAGLNLICYGGMIAGLLLLLNAWPRAALVFCWIFDLSFVSAARNFSGFQSDGLMLETVLLAVFLAPRGLRPGLGERTPSSVVVRLLFWWLCFRLIFEPGIAKSMGGDEAWKTFSALQDYYVNCPFPTWLGWYAQHLPDWVHSGMTGATLYVEVVGPFLFFLGRKGRILLCLLWGGMNLGILLTGNYTFLNYNSIALAMLLLDDRAIRKILPFLPERKTGVSPAAAAWWRKVTASVVLLPFFYIGLYIFLAVMRVPVNSLPAFTRQPLVLLGNFRSANRYALFGSMTHHRHHIEYEGSNDGGLSWKTYRFKWQAQDTGVAPRFMAPHLPRFDWNLWFAQLGVYGNERHRFVLLAGARLIEGEADVTALFAHNPFPESPPQIIRFKLYRYSFTILSEKKETGQWWRREDIGYWAPYLYRDTRSGTFRLVSRLSDIPVLLRYPQPK